MGDEHRTKDAGVRSLRVRSVPPGYYEEHSAVHAASSQNMSAACVGGGSKAAGRSGGIGAMGGEHRTKDAGVRSVPAILWGAQCGACSIIV